MAIRRCPYCKAIIDEEDKYCNNCGTQLLFPEDEFEEEEIPGDKIIDEEEEEEAEPEEPDEEQELEGELEEEEELEEESEETEPEEEEAEAGEEKEEAGEEEQEPGAEPSERADAEAEEDLEEEAEEEEDAAEEELEKAEEAAEETPAEPPAEARPGEAEAELEDELREEEEAAPETEGPGGAREEASDGEPGSLMFPPPTAGTGKKYEVSLEKDELVFKTKNMEQLTGTVDEGKKAVESLLESPPDFGTKDTGVDTKEFLPLWARGIRETPVAVESAAEEGGRPTPHREWTTDSGIGVPEKIATGTPAIEDTSRQEIRTQDEEREGVEEETEEAGEEVERPRRPVSLSMKLKAKVVDWVFVTALWLISLAFTSQVLGVPFFSLIFGSPGPVLAFYAILLILYFFLFLYFLGETLGDHYFTEDD